MRRLVALAVVMALAPAWPVVAQQKKKPAPEKKAEKPIIYRLGDLTLSAIWSHSSATRNGAAFLKIKNASEDDDALIDASTPVAKRVELHGTGNIGEAWRTLRVDEIPTPAKQDTVLTGATMHLKLIGLRGALKAGEEIPVTLTFERAGAITVKAKVLSAEDAAKMIELTRTGKAPVAKPKRPMRSARPQGQRR